MRLQLAILVALTGVAWADDPPVASQAPGATVDDDLAREIMAQNAARPAEQPAVADDSEPMTSTVRAGGYTDSDNTTVLRLLGIAGKHWGNWTAGASIAVDSVTSASVDVRSSPLLSKVDTMTSASGRTSTSGGEMTDTRYQLTANGGWQDTSGHALTLTGAVAHEHDYASVSGGANGSYDILGRTATLMGGITITDNWVSSVLDDTIHRKMLAIGWSLGLARVLTPDDAIRVRYDGKADAGYNSSPYRNVRFGDWTATLGAHKITFANTIGDADGLLEKTPSLRASHALVGEWVHALGIGFAVHPELRASYDSWGIASLTAGADFRISQPTWRLEAGYRYYLQGAADFFLDKYVMAPDAYAYYTSDKELGHESGHLARLDLARALTAPVVNDTHVMLTLQLDYVHYDYAGFLLLPSRDSYFGLLGLSIER